ncbi:MULTISPECIES: type II toxin-antitoxin system RelE/ParE family toxin [unclassified Moorena]|uniref:type II toxin-antitoxin system RelE family toxin n=1 Tax=unclassified Moorena TaxID=2683338 RepID=UPI0013FFD53E|nr:MULTISPECIES: type II toxin-antitoxin system RelE/ParE family toxin [unclassified Moorena]NEO16233.1 type II toxin-antitoxin system RelE/ParE family toxin [Moorena sp. SIO3E8]NEQ02111.1 type II toxin-antitoxin system RelE/ParE family toxin [Moorena sp. SIO3F7]
MKTEYLPTFLKDIKSLKSTPVYRTIKKLTFQDILSCHNLRDINNIKKLKGEDNAYRIRVGDYRIGFFLKGDTIIFSRVLHRR